MSIVYEVRIRDINPLETRIVQGIRIINVTMLFRVWKNTKTRVDRVVEQNGRHIKHLTYAIKPMNYTYIIQANIEYSSIQYPFIEIYFSSGTLRHPVIQCEMYMRVASPNFTESCLQSLANVNLSNLLLQ